jgi:hypothetical protein
MKLPTLIFVLVANVVLVGTAWCQTLVTGKIVANFNITLSSAIPAGDLVFCRANASVYDCSASVAESATGIATRSGNSATCSATIAYSWNLSCPRQDQISLNYQAEAKPAVNVSPSQFRALSSLSLQNLTVNDINNLINTAGAARMIDRNTSQYGPSINIPPNGTTTPVTANISM